MLSPSLSIALGFAFVLLGAINVWLVLEAWSRVKAARVSARMLTLHRIGGYLFIGLFCVMMYYMLARLGTGGDNSASVTLHMALAMILSPLLFIKVLIARYYDNQQNLLMPFENSRADIPELRSVHDVGRQYPVEDRISSAPESLLKRFSDELNVNVSAHIITPTERAIVANARATDIHSA